MKPIKFCLNQQLAEICQRSIELEELTDKVSAALPTELTPHCKVSSFNKGCLNLLVHDAVWASTLRYALPDLRDKLRAMGLYQLSSIKITVAYSEQEYTKPAHKTPSSAIPEAAKESILHESKACSYEPLRNALARLVE